MAEALAGAEVVVDVANSPSFEDKPAMEFFETSGRNLLAAEKAAVGGEGSGGVVVPQWARWFDGFTTMGVLLERMALKKKTVSDLAALLPPLDVDIYVLQEVVCGKRDDQLAK